MNTTWLRRGPLLATLLGLASASPLPTLARDACRPLALLPAGKTLQFGREAQELAPRLRAVLASEQPLTAERAAFGLVPPAIAGVLTSPAAAPVQTLGLGAVDLARSELVFEGGNAGVAILSWGERRFRVTVKNGKALAADGQPLMVAPALLQPSAFTVAKGATVRAGRDGQVLVAKGATVSWGMDDALALPFVLTNAALLEETTAASSGVRVVALHPTRAAPGAPLQVQVQAPGFNFRDKTTLFCFAASADGAVQKAGIGKLVSQTGDVATFDVLVPADKSLTPGATWHSDAVDLYDRVFGVPTLLRVIGYDDGQVVLDASSNFNLSSVRTAAMSGLVLLVGLLFVSALFVGRLNPLWILAELARHSSGRYSLSNVQILLWTMLVIFTLCFVWVSTGEIVAISSGVLVLLGISGGSSVLSRAIETKPASGAAPVERLDAAAKDLVQAEDGNGFDLLRFQMLGFTLFTWSYSLLSVLHSEGLPEIPENLYLLMGISNATYLGGKLSDRVGKKDEPAATGGADELSAAELALGMAMIKQLQTGLGIAANGILDPATREAVKVFKLTHGIAPADGRVDALLIDKVLKIAPPTQ